VENCLSGFNSSIFAYGQTGSGKTHTMIGQLPDQHSNSLPADVSTATVVVHHMQLLLVHLVLVHLVRVCSVKRMCLPRGCTCMVGCTSCLCQMATAVLLQHSAGAPCAGWHHTSDLQVPLGTHA
jgi:hypothetical protein